MKARYLKTGLSLGTLWGFLSTAIIVSVGMFRDEAHPYHWLFLVFQSSVQTWWFKTLFLPFLLSFEAGPIFAFFGSTPVGALIGGGIGALASVLSYMIRKR